MRASRLGKFQPLFKSLPAGAHSGGLEYLCGTWREPTCTGPSEAREGTSGRNDLNPCLATAESLYRRNIWLFRSFNLALDASTGWPDSWGQTVPDQGARLHLLVTASLHSLGAVTARPQAELRALMEPMFKEGLTHRLFAGRSHRDAADYLNDAHSARCSPMQRPQMASLFSPGAPSSIAASTAIDTGCHRELALQLIHERYKIAENALHYTPAAAACRCPHTDLRNSAEACDEAKSFLASS